MMASVFLAFLYCCGGIIYGSQSVKASPHHGPIPLPPCTKEVRTVVDQNNNQHILVLIDDCAYNDEFVKKSVEDYISSEHHHHHNHYHQDLRHLHHHQRRPTRRESNRYNLPPHLKQDPLPTSYSTRAQHRANENCHSDNDYDYREEKTIENFIKHLRRQKQEVGYAVENVDSAGPSETEPIVGMAVDDPETDEELSETSETEARLLEEDVKPDIVGASEPAETETETELPVRTETQAETEAESVQPVAANTEDKLEFVQQTPESILIVQPLNLYEEVKPQLEPQPLAEVSPQEETELLQSDPINTEPRINPEAPKLSQPEEKESKLPDITITEAQLETEQLEEAVSPDLSSPTIPIVGQAEPEFKTVDKASQLEVVLPVIPNTEAQLETQQLEEAESPNVSPTIPIVGQAEPELEPKPVDKVSQPEVVLPDTANTEAQVETEQLEEAVSPELSPPTIPIVGQAEPELESKPVDKVSQPEVALPVITNTDDQLETEQLEDAESPNVSPSIPIVGQAELEPTPVDIVSQPDVVLPVVTNTEAQLETEQLEEAESPVLSLPTIPIVGQAEPELEPKPVVKVIQPEVVLRVTTNTKAQLETEQLEEAKSPNVSPSNPIVGQAEPTPVDIVSQPEVVLPVVTNTEAQLETEQLEEAVSTVLSPPTIPNVGQAEPELEPKPIVKVIQPEVVLPDTTPITEAKLETEQLEEAESPNLSPSIPIVGQSEPEREPKPVDKVSQPEVVLPDTTPITEAKLETEQLEAESPELSPSTIPIVRQEEPEQEPKPVDKVIQPEVIVTVIPNLGAKMETEQLEEAESPNESPTIPIVEQAELEPTPADKVSQPEVVLSVVTNMEAQLETEQLEEAMSPVLSPPTIPIVEPSEPELEPKPVNKLSQPEQKEVILPVITNTEAQLETEQLEEAASPDLPPPTIPIVGQAEPVLEPNPVDKVSQPEAVLPVEADTEAQLETEQLQEVESPNVSPTIPIVGQAEPELEPKPVDQEIQPEVIVTVIPNPEAKMETEQLEEAVSPAQTEAVQYPIANVNDETRPDLISFLERGILIQNENKDESPDEGVTDLEASATNSEDGKTVVKPDSTDDFNNQAKLDELVENMDDLRLVQTIGDRSRVFTVQRIKVMDDENENVRIIKFDVDEVDEPTEPEETQIESPVEGESFDRQKRDTIKRKRTKSPTRTLYSMESDSSSSESSNERKRKTYILNPNPLIEHKYTNHFRNIHQIFNSESFSREENDSDYQYSKRKCMDCRRKSKVVPFVKQITHSVEFLCGPCEKFGKKGIASMMKQIAGLKMKRNVNAGVK